MRPLSYTKFRMYSTCPLMYKLFYIDGHPERPRPEYSFGRSVHAAIQAFHEREPPPATLEELMGYLDQHWVTEGHRSPDEEAGQRELARRILRDFFEDETRDGYRAPLAVEMSFNIEVDGIPLTGRMDAVNRLEDGSLEVLDYKSGDREHTEASVAGSPQLGIYQMAVERTIGGRVSRLTIYDLRMRRKVSAPGLAPAEKDGLRRAIVTAARCIEAGMFDPVLNGDCPCDWAAHCPYFRDHFRGRGQTTLMDHAEEAAATDIALVVRRFSDILRDRGRSDPEAGHLEAEIMRYCQERGLLRAFGEDRMATMVQQRSPSDEAYWYINSEEMTDGLRARLEDLRPGRER